MCNGVGISWLSISNGSRHTVRVCDILGSLVVVVDARVMLLSLTSSRIFPQESGSLSFCTPTLRQRISSHVSPALYQQGCKLTGTGFGYSAAFVEVYRAHLHDMLGFTFHIWCSQVLQVCTNSKKIKQTRNELMQSHVDLLYIYKSERTYLIAQQFHHAWLVKCYRTPSMQSHIHATFRDLAISLQMHQPGKLPDQKA